MSTPIQSPRYYGYFQATQREYQAGAVGWIGVVPDLRWYGLPSSRVLVLTHRQTPVAAGPTERNVILHEWVIVTDDEAAMPTSMQTIGGYDPQGQAFPAFGIFVQLSFNYSAGVTTRDYLGRDGSYSVTDLLVRPNLETGPVQLFVQGVREVITHLDNATWKGPGSAIVYDRESSFGWVTKSDAQEFDLQKDQHWVPGAASVYERMLMGTGTLDGWCVYALQHLLLVEFWRGGVFLTSRMLDVQPFAKFLNDPNSEFTFGLGYDYPRGVISLGVAGTGTERSEIAHVEWQVPELQDYSYEHKQVYIGGAPTLYADGAQANRTAWGWLKPVQGQFTSEDYLTRGKLAELHQER